MRAQECPICGARVGKVCNGPGGQPLKFDHLARFNENGDWVTKYDREWRELPYRERFQCNPVYKKAAAA